MKKLNFLFSTSFCLCIGLFLLPKPVQSQVSITLDKVKPIYAVGEKAALKIASTVAGQGTYEILYDLRDPLSVIQRGTFSIQQGRADTLVLFGLPQAGVVFFKVQQGGGFALTTALFDPLSIAPLETEPTDFDAFWQREKEKLRAVPMNPQLTLQNTLPNGSKLYIISFDNVDGRKIYGYLAVPRAQENSLPSFNCRRLATRLFKQKASSSTILRSVASPLFCIWQCTTCRQISKTRRHTSPKTCRMQQNTTIGT